MSGFVVFWAAALALSLLLLYVLLDGFDLGVGMLFPFAPSERSRREMLSAISPVWDGNETWLVVTAAVLFGAFPLVYSIAISAFYLPILSMLASLILRGVAFEFRAKSRGMRRVWDAGFVGGSYVATFMQGTAVGAIAAELPLAADSTMGLRFTGGPMFWAQPLPLLCGLGLCVGYALMGASLLVGKTEGPSRDFAWRVVPWLLGALLLFLVAALAISLSHHLQVLQRWIDRPWLVIFPLVGLCRRGGARPGMETPDRRLAVPRHVGDLPRRVRHAGGVVPALHDPVQGHGRAGRRARREPRLPVLGCRHRRAAADARLHDRRLFRFSGQGRGRHGGLLMRRMATNHSKARSATA